MSPVAGYTKRRARWETEAVLDKLREWTEQYGEPPTANDWNPSDCMRAANRSASRARAWTARAERFYSGEWPWTGSVAKLFAGWNSALEAAGLPVRYRRSRLDVAALAPDIDMLRGLIADAETALADDDPERLLRVLCTIADGALAWATGIEAT